MKINFLKKCNKEEQIPVANAWEVRWNRRYGEYSDQVEPAVVVCLTKEDADKFKKSLKEAFELLQHTSGTRVTVNLIKYEVKE